MKKIIIFIFILIILSCETINIIIPNDIKKSLVRSMEENREDNPIYREFRAAWFSTVVNIDFPIKNGSETERIKVKTTIGRKTMPFRPKVYL